MDSGSSIFTLLTQAQSRTAFAILNKELTLRTAEHRLSGLRERARRLSALRLMCKLTRESAAAEQFSLRRRRATALRLLSNWRTIAGIV